MRQQHAQADEACRIGGRKGRLVLEGIRNDNARLLLALTGKASDAIQHAHLRDRCMAINGINTMVAVLSFTFGESLCGTWANSMTLGAALAKR